MPPFVSIIIVNFNAGTHLQRCVEAVKQQSHKDFEAIIVDNASTDDSVAEAILQIAGDARFRVLKMSENLGFSAGNNRGAAIASGHWIATLNPDAFPEENWLEELLAAANYAPDVAMFGSMQFDTAAPSALDGAGDRYFAAGAPWRDQSSARYDAARQAGAEMYETFSPCAAAALYRAKEFHEAEGFDESFFCFVEDVDLGFRLRRSGHRCRQVVSAKVLHVGGGAGGGASEFARYHGTRNLIWCFFKNMPLPLIVILGPAHLLLLLTLILKAISRGQGSMILRAVYDGFSGLGHIWKARRRTPQTESLSNIMAALDWSPVNYFRHRYRKNLVRPQSSSNAPL